MQRFLISLLTLTFSASMFVTPVYAEQVKPVPVQKLEFYSADRFEKTGEITLPFIDDHLSFRAADLGQDGQAEIILGSPSGSLPEVIVLRSDGSEITRWQAYVSQYRGGVQVAVGDVTADGHNEIITGTRESGGPHIRVFSPKGELLAQWFAYSSNFRAGVSLAVGDVIKDKPGQEVLVSQGEGQPAMLRLFTYRGELLSEWYPFGEDFTGGLNIDVAPDGLILAARAFGKSPLVRVFNRFGGLVNEFMAYEEGFPGGVQAQAMEQSNGSWNIFTVPGFSGGPHVRNFDSDGTPLSPGFMAFETTYRGGLEIDQADMNGDGRKELVVGMASITPGPQQSIKSILVDLSEQKLYTYYRGQLQKTYLISSGVKKYPTPTGEFSISRKRDQTRMTWFYGPDNPDNYDLKDVPWVMTFHAAFNIHGAYWHHNFGHPMSHGCVNMSVPDSKEVYNWAEIGTAVLIQA